MVPKIIEPKIKSLVHDRFVIDKYKAYVLPSIDVIKRGQLSEILESKNRKEILNQFEDIFENSKDIIQDWNEIKKIKDQRI